MSTENERDASGASRHERSATGTVRPSAVIVIALLLLLPLVVDLRLTDAWELPRATLLWFGSLLALGTLLAEKTFGLPVKRPSALTGLLFVATLAAVGISTAASVSPVRSLVGDMGRYEGLLTFAAYGALFFVASQGLSGQRGIRLIVTSQTAVAVALSLYGVLQYFGIDPITWPEGRFETFRAFSLLGNPMFFGEYLALCLPLALSGALATRGRSRALFFVASVIVTTALAATVTRGAWIGATVGVVMTLVIFAGGVTRLKGLARPIAVGAAVTVVVALVAIALGPASRQVGSRVSSSADLLGGTTGTRIELARSSVAMIADRPLRGWGPDTYRLVFPGYATLRHYRLAGRDVVADNAHSYPLHLAATSGVPGLLAFSGLVIACLVQARPSRRGSGKDPGLVAGVSGAVVGYLASLMFGISIVAVSAIMWTILGALAGQDPTGRTQRMKPVARWSAVASLAALLMIATVLLVQPYRAEAAFSHAMSAGALPDATIETFHVASERAPYQDQYLLAAGFYLNGLANATGEDQYRLAAIERFLAAQHVAPLETNTYTFLGATYLDLADATGREEYRLLAIEQLKIETRLAPNFAPGHYLLGRAYMSIDDDAGAIRSLTIAVAKDPTYTEARTALAEAYKRTGEPEPAMEATGKADGL